VKTNQTKEKPKRKNKGVYMNMKIKTGVRVSCCLFVLLSSLAALIFSITAPRAYAAGSGSGVVVRFQGNTALATFDSVSPDGCIDTAVFVTGTQSSTGPEADVTISQYDFCTDTPLLFAFGSTSTPNFQVSGGLASASLSATISVIEFVSGNTFPVSVSVTWTATGPFSRIVGTEHLQFGNLIETFHRNDTFRDASASGTVSDGTTNFTPSPSVFAQIASFRSSDVVISHP
jgi:hypothetical protein